MRSCCPALKLYSSRSRRRHRQTLNAKPQVYPQVVAIEAEQVPEERQLQKLAGDSDRIGLRLLPLLPTEVIAGAPSYCVDIVAVHGLGGDFYTTWAWPGDKSRKQDVFWLSQLLPRDLPGARVFSFGYASELVFSRSVAGIRDYARQLLQALLRYTEEV